MRFGGRYSPDGQTRSHGGAGQPAPAPLRHPLESRTGWITAAAVPFLFSAFFQDVAGMVGNLGGFGLVASGMWMTRQGLQAQAEYDARRVARRPAIPRKLFGGVMAALGLAFGAGAMDAPMAASLLGLTGFVLHFLAFGPDPMRNKGMEGIDAFQQDRVARMVDEGQAHLDAMADAILRTNDRRLEARVAMFQVTVQDLFRQVEQNPGDLSAARRYMGVYLLGAREATLRFADLYAQTRDARALADWQALLDDLETNFAARTRQFIEGGRTDLDIQMSVLRERLEREGVRPAIEQRDEPGFAEWLRDPAKTGRR